ncbi:MAG: nicotinate-nucleotide adenylyltransferase [Dehalococcoidales bacterium]|nr:nicotinate-nucleotide adenylyltransferase [Dehalococcoidales bacterium]
MGPEATEKAKIGVLGGTFDPVHLGHLAVAEEVRRALNLGEVLLVPSGVPVMRRQEAVTPPEMRLAMLELAVGGIPYLKVSRREIDRPGVSYTVETLAGLKKDCGDSTDLYFILGWDNLEQFWKWRRPDEIIRLCHLVAVPRPGYPRPSLELLEEKVPGISARVIFLDGPYLDISASAIRRAVAGGRPFEHLVPTAVAEYIKRHHLYLHDRQEV